MNQENIHQTHSGGASSPHEADDVMGVGEKFERPKIWKSVLVWRITMALFFTILIVQSGLFYISGLDYKSQLQNQMIETARAAIVPALNPIHLSGPDGVMSKQAAMNILTSTSVAGFDVYRLDGMKLAAYGQAPTLIPQDDSHDFLAADWGFYERVLLPAELGKPYRIVVRTDAAHLKDSMMMHIIHAAQVVLLLSAFVTTVLMLVLSRWLLEPIIELRNNLSRVRKDPENAHLYETHAQSNDAIGSLILAANDLIHQNAQNIHKLKEQAKDTIHQLAYYDSLTGLPNRSLYVQQLEKTIDLVAKRKDKKVAVAVIDLDHFKDINDTKGHHVGDQLLAAVGQRLKEVLPDDIYVSRSGEDEFAIITVVKTDDDIEEKVAGIISHALEKPFKAAKEEFQIRGSIGIACYPDDAKEAHKLLKSADIALNHAKAEGRDTVRYYSSDFDEAIQNRVAMVKDLRHAIDNDELSLFYQPQFDLKTGAIVGAEALLRWFKPVPGQKEPQFISPGEFIPVAEQSGLILPIGEWVLKTACKQLQTWEKQGHNLRVAVNISAIQFQQNTLVGQVENMLKETGITPKNLELEVTESVFMDDMDRTISTLKQLSGLGVEIAIDDFGTGYSSLNYLRQFPIDRLKIDQSFIANILETKEDAAIAKTIIKLGHALDLKVIAEGVETSEHEAFLKAQECDEVQGYLYSRPISVTDFEAFLKKRS